MHHPYQFIERQRGFTLVELIMVIVILGVIGGMVSVFMKSPIDAYFASGRRAALTDVADTAVRRIARDLHKALPNSVRTSTDKKCVEFIPTKTGGRYRAAAPGDFLDFTSTTLKFNMLGSNPASSDQSIGIGDVIVVYNLGPGINDAYSSINTSSVTAVGSSVVVAPGTGSETPITINGKQFPLPSGGNRFHVVPSAEQVVGYVCMADSTLRRYVMTLPYPTMTTCPSSPPAASILALNAACAFDYSGSDLQRNALVSMRLQLTDTGSGESVNLYHEVHVDNTP